MTACAEGRARERWSDATPGGAAWVTLFSRGLTASEAMSAGVAEIPEAGFLPLHPHAPAEIHFVLDGSGVMTIEGRDSTVGPGDAVFIPGDAEHGIRNAGEATLRFFYVFPVDRFDQLVYRFGQP